MNRVGRARKLGSAIIHAQENIAAIALIAMMMTVVVDVFLRHTAKMPVRGAYDLVSILLLVMVLFGGGSVLLRGKEILIDLVDAFLPSLWIRILTGISAVLALSVLIFMVWAMIPPALSAHKYGDRSLEIGLPVWILWCTAFVGLAGMIAAVLLRIRAIFENGPINSENNREHSE